MHPGVSALVILLVIWFLLSGQPTAWFITLGILSCLLVTFLSQRMGLLQEKMHTPGFYMRFLVYVPWLVKQVLVANGRLAFYILFMKNDFNPGFIHLHLSPKSTLAQATLANSITLTSGTFVCAVKEDSFEVHAFHQNEEDMTVLQAFDRQTARLSRAE